MGSAGRRIRRGAPWQGVMFTMNNSEVIVTQYDKSHCEIIESGVKSIASYYDSKSLSERRTILLCLDRYLDPYYGNELPFNNEIFDWLVIEFDKTSNITLKEDIFDLVENYSRIKIEGYEIDDNGNLVKTDDN